MNITLDDIKTQHAKVGEMITAFEARATHTIVLPETRIELKQGELYAGAIIDGKRFHHIILLPEERKKVKWGDAIKWAQGIGGDLPTRQEQSLLFANLKSEFQEEYYWSNTQHAANSDYAWCQHFSNGYQGYNDKSAELRARAVRRLLVIQ